MIEEARGKTPVLAGAGGNDTAHVIDMARECESDGRERNPFRQPVLQLNRAQEGLYQHFKANLPRAVRVPVILYNIPGRTWA